MSKLSNILNNISDYEKIVEMANLDKRRTGIDKVIIHVHSGKGLHHGPRVKVSNIYNKFSNDNFSIKLSDMSIVNKVKIKTDELDQVFKWINLNKKAIETYWNRGDEMITDDFYNMIVKI